VRALAFVVTALESDRRLRTAVVCPEARYVSVITADHTSVIRRFLCAADWNDVEYEIARGMSHGPMSRSSAIARVLTDGAAAAMVLPLRSDEIPLARPQLAGAWLDRFLRDCAGCGLTDD
jgi:hypothetical protein